MDDYLALGVGPAGSYITGVTVTEWGTTLVVHCVYMANDLPFQIKYHDCHKIEWSVHAPEDAREEYADLLGIHIGEAGHQRAALIVTSICELTILYGSYTVVKEW